MWIAMPAIWMGIIFIASTHYGSNAHTYSFSVHIIRYWFPDISPAHLYLMVSFIRKSGHVMAYAVLAVLWFFVFQKNRVIVSVNALENASERAWRMRAAAWAFCLSCLWAFLDEFHQLFVPSRSPTFLDVLIDALSALLGLFFLLGIPWIRKSPSDLLLSTAQSFGWWFAWGGFSSILLLIVAKGVGFSLPGIVYIIFGVGLFTGLLGMFYHVQRHRTNTCPTSNAS